MRNNLATSHKNQEMGIAQIQSLNIIFRYGLNGRYMNLKSILMAFRGYNFDVRAHNKFTTRTHLIDAQLNHKQNFPAFWFKVCIIYLQSLPFKQPGNGSCILVIIQIKRNIK
jgi:hypothetical protein